MNNLLIIAVGGALGSVSRYGLGVAVQGAVPTAFPWGIVVVNLLGCFLFGVVAGLVARGNVLPGYAESALLIGFLGGFTTFSTFAFNNATMLQDGRIGWLAANLLIQNIGGIVLLFAGLLLTRPR